MDLKTVTGAIHIFRERSDLTLKSLYRGCQKQLEEKRRFKELGLPYENVPFLKAVKYPHAVSEFFDQFWLSPDYWAASDSKHYKARTLVTVVGWDTEQGIQVLKAYFGADGKCAARCELIVDGKSRKCAVEGIDDLHDGFAGMISGDSLIYRLCDDLMPMDIVRSLEKDLGVFMGSTDLEEYLRTHCRLRQEYELACFYESDRFCPDKD